MSTNLQSIVLAGISPTGLSHGASVWVDPVDTDSSSGENAFLRIDLPGTTAEPVDSSAPAAPRKPSPEEIRSHAVAEVVDADLLETILAAKIVAPEETDRLPVSSARRNYRLDGPDQSRQVSDELVDLSAFTANEEGSLRRCLKRSLPPAYVDTVIRLVSRSRTEMVEELGRCLDHRTRQLHQAVGVIQKLVREKNELASKAGRFDRIRGNLAEVHATLRGVHHEMVHRKIRR